MTTRTAATVGDLVATMAHETCAVMVAQAVAERAVFVVTSPLTGTGKTRSTLHAATACGRPVLHLVMSPATNPLGVNAELLAAAGATTPRGLPLWESTLETVELLGDLDAVVVVDDAHRLGAEALAHLDVLHRRSYTALGVVGGPTLARRHGRDTELFDRVDRWVDMPPLNRTAMLDALPVHHPLFATAARRRLHDLDTSFCRGRWRRWDQFLAAALRYTDGGTGPLDDTTFDNVLTALAWHQRPVPGGTP